MSYVERGARGAHQLVCNILDVLQEDHLKQGDSIVVESTVDLQIKMPQTATQVRTCDTKGMFAELRHPYIKEAINILALETIDRHPGRYLTVNQKRAKWVTGQPTPHNANHFTLDRINNIVSFILDNDYVIIASDIYKVIQGVPMGSPSSPGLATLVAHYMERDLMKTMRINHPQGFAARYVDDLFYTYNETFLRSYDDAARRSGIQMIPDGADPLTTTFLDCRLTVKHGQIMSTWYSKKEEMFPDDQYLPNRSDARSWKSHTRQLEGLILRVYNSTSSKRQFHHKLESIINKTPYYTRRNLSKAITKVMARIPNPRF